MPAALSRPSPSNQRKANSIPMYCRYWDYGDLYDWKPQVDAKTISRLAAGYCIIVSPSRSRPEDPELKCRDLPHCGGFSCPTHAKTQLNDISVISVNCPAIPEKLTQ
jgi:hypothetical protein